MKRLLPTAKVEDRTGRRKSWIYNKVAAGEFPKPVQPGLWLESDVDAYIDSLIAKRDQGAAA